MPFIERVYSVLIVSAVEKFNTSLTTLIMVLLIYIMGVTSIKEFALPMMAGIIAGTFSSVFISGTIWAVMKGKKK